jgi:L-methionine (R)-S-oxide reductase
MAEDLVLANGSKEEQYKFLLPQIEAVIYGEPDLYANLGNICSALKEQFGWLWVGFYLVKPSLTGEDEELVLGPFQGPLACTRIRKGKGVCGAAWDEAKTIIVPDVEQFPGHIACSSKSKSEIVLPVIRNKKVVAVLDVDSESLNTYDETDKINLENLISKINWILE